MLSSCISTQMTHFQGDESQTKNNLQQIEPAKVKIFLLERDIPLNFERLGILKIVISSEMANFSNIEEKLRNECAKIGANGAYRINEGTIFLRGGGTISYLCFRY